MPCSAARSRPRRRCYRRSGACTKRSYAGATLWTRRCHRPVLQRDCGGTRIVTASADHGLDERSKGMGQTNVLAPEEAPVGDCEKSQAAGIDDHLAKTVTPERRAAVVERWRKGRGCEDRVADKRDVLDTQVLAALQELEQRSRGGLVAPPST